jgi:hypothetical protein
MATPTVPAPDPAPQQPRRQAAPRRSSTRTSSRTRTRRHRITALLLLVVILVAGAPPGSAGPASPATAAAWWALDSGPFARSPRDILTETSPTGAVRVFGDHPGQDARTAARETVDALDRAGGLDRRVLSVDLPTGSGWVDPDEVTALERWAGGDIASVSVRYSAAPSAAVLLLHRDLAVDSARALLHEVVDRVDRRDPARRPAIVVHGESLGAFVGTEVLTDPRLDAAVASRLWQGTPGGAHAGAPTGPGARCTVADLNDDDPVGQLSTRLLVHPVQALTVLTDLPGSENRPAGSGHSYRPVLPPAGCVR